jgi:hypothetical protein
LEWDLAVGIDEAVVADFHKTGGEHVLQEAAEELHDIESENSRSFAVGLAVTNAHGAVPDTEDARIGDGDFEEVGGEIFESGGEKRAAPERSVSQQNEFVLDSTAWRRARCQSLSP